MFLLVTMELFFVAAQFSAVVSFLLLGFSKLSGWGHFLTACLSKFFSGLVQTCFSLCKPCCEVLSDGLGHLWSASLWRSAKAFCSFVISAFIVCLSTSCLCLVLMFYSKLVMKTLGTNQVDFSEPVGAAKPSVLEVSDCWEPLSFRQSCESGELCRQNHKKSDKKEQMVDKLSPENHTDHTNCLTNCLISLI